MGVGRTIILLMLMTLLAVSAYFLYINVSDLIAEPIDFMRKPADKNLSSFEEGNFQFYSNMRFNKKRISYNIDTHCTEDKIERTKTALKVLEDETKLLKFYPESENNADIIISCSEEAESEASVSERYYIAGEGGPTSIINTSLFYVIESGKVLLFYETSRCDSYNIELHELLHVFGFEHSNNKGSIMYNFSSCNQVLNTDIIDELIRLYSIEALPDLFFEEATASTQGRYLNFEVSIKNQGLTLAENVILEIYADDEKAKTFDLENIDYGEGKSLSVENMKLPSYSVDDIKFLIKSNNRELNSKNNELELTAG